MQPGPNGRCVCVCVGWQRAGGGGGGWGRAILPDALSFSFFSPPPLISASDFPVTSYIVTSVVLCECRRFKVPAVLPCDTIIGESSHSFVCYCLG